VCNFHHGLYEIKRRKIASTIPIEKNSTFILFFVNIKILQQILTTFWGGDLIF
jgi:hypothetical protein